MRIKIYLGKAWKGKTRLELKNDEDGISKLQAKPVDERIVFEDQETYVSVVEQVAENMSKIVNPNDDAEVKAFLDEFAELPETERRRLGVWA